MADPVSLLSSPFMGNLARGLGEGLGGGGGPNTSAIDAYTPMDGSNWTVNFKSPGASGASVAGPLGLSPASSGSLLVWGAIAVAGFLILRQARKK